MGSFVSRVSGELLRPLRASWRAFTFHLGTSKSDDRGATYVAFAPDGKSAVATDSSHLSGDTPIARWDLSTGATTFAAKTILYPEGVDISHDGKLAVVDGGGSNAVVVELPSLKVIHATMNETAASGSMLFSKDDAALVNDWQGLVTIDDPRSLKHKKEFAATIGAVSPDRTKVALAGKAFWGVVDASRGKKVVAFEGSPKTKDHAGLWLSYSPDGARVAVHHNLDQMLFVWSAETGKLVGKTASSGGVLSWTRDGSFVIVDGAPIDLATMKASPKLPEGWMTALTGREVLVGGEGRATEIDVSTSKPTGRSWELADKSEQSAVAFNPDRSLMAFGRKVGTLRVVRLSDGKTLDLGVVRADKAQKGFAVSSDGRFEGAPDTAGCAARAAGRAVEPAPGLVRAFFAR
jgi:WD40 repeat protein